ncbi:wound-induced 1-like protein [Trifolium pratense]|uniref:Wound-induced 1-like protein n=3 Tax=Trifolium TaxID=3898 RepID=A0A2K3P0C5_TRIPR|nr:wound-induced 1-like protein [Trifolium pratense]
MRWKKGSSGTKKRISTFLELANSQKSSEDTDSSNQKLVLKLYEALNSRDSDTVVKILASDLEWWFHGPPSHQFLMRMLTGDSTAVDTFRFVPQSLVSFGSIVIVEGCDNSRKISWVHALTVVDGIVTQVREYFNTSLTVTRFAGKESGEIVPAVTDSGRFPCVWESSVSNRVGKSVPGLVLAI